MANATTVALVGGRGGLLRWAQEPGRERRGSCRTQDVTIWWVVVTVGVLSYTATAFGTTRAYDDEAVPRLGWWPEFSSHRPPWWTWAAFGVGIALMAIGCRELGQASAIHWWEYFLVCLAISWLAQVAIVVAHNRHIVKAAPPAEAGV
jgi:hypothetical protein